MDQESQSQALDSVTDHVEEEEANADDGMNGPSEGGLAFKFLPEDLVAKEEEKKRLRTALTLHKMKNETDLPLLMGELEVDENTARRMLWENDWDLKRTLLAHVRGASKAAE